MARRETSSTSPTTTTEAPAEATTQEEAVTEVTEAPVTETPTSTEPVTVTEPSTSTETKPEEAPVDLTAFNAAVETALKEKDTATGELALAIIAPVQTEYRKLDGVKAKNAAKKVLNDAVKAGMNAMDIQTARANMQLLDAMTPASGGGTKSSEPKAPADPTEAFAERVAALNLAYNLAIGDVPEGVKEDWETKVGELVSAASPQASAYLAWTLNEAEDKGDAPEASNVAVSAVKLSQGKAAGRRASGTSTPFTGERRDIAKHIAEAFEGSESGAFLTIAEIRNHKSEEYGDNPPSAGAISARLFPSSGKCTIEGVTPGTNDKGNKGATKD